jgi:hypothetical protein
MKHITNNAIDSQEQRFIRLNYNELEKNHQGAEEKEQILHENPTSDRCPFKSLDKYLEKLTPKCPWFLQRPDPKFHTREYWYVNAPLGVHTIANMLNDISKAASTSKEYTNHCVKATVGTVLKKAGVPSWVFKRISRNFHKIYSWFTFCDFISVVTREYNMYNSYL